MAFAPSCLVKNINGWYNAVDLGRLVGVAFIALNHPKQARDTVDDKIQRQTCELYGVQKRCKSYIPTGSSFVGLKELIQPS